MPLRTTCVVRYLLVALLLAPATGQAQTSLNRLTPEELADGWLLLFDGETLFGWRAMTDANWRVADGVISVSAGEPGLLRTTAQFGDCALRFEFRAPAETNSGVFVHTSPAPVSPTVDCYEVNIAAEGVSPFPTGSLVGRVKADRTFDAADWLACEVQVAAGRITVAIDGVETAAYEDPRPLGRGFIGLQFNHGLVEFRNLKLRPLGLEPIFNGRDLTGWRSHPQSRSEFTVTPEGWLHVQNGSGMLEHERPLGDFVLQLECISNGEHLNSGVFFRSIPGEMMNGYESQIHNGYHDGDRSRPIDCGTGGIFRRHDARRVNADDFEWFSKTIIATGPHVAVWVNGLQVTDWTDTRAPDDNPRRGLRLAPGTIILQGHDPTTDLHFRHLRAVETPPRVR